VRFLVVAGVVLAALGAPPAVAAAAAASPVLFVSPQGSDGAAGTRDHPLRTPQVAVDRARAGGTVRLLPGTYLRQRIVVRDRHDLTITGPHATLDATGLEPLDGDSAVVEIEDSTRITVRGLDITGYRTSTLGQVPIGIYVTGSGAAISLVGNHVHDLGHDNQTLGSFDINAHGIAVYGRDPHSPIAGLRIARNEVDHLDLGASEAVVVNGNVIDWAVIANRVHDVDNIGIDAIGYEETLPAPYRYTDRNRARHGVIARNVVDGVVSAGNPAYWEDGGWCNCADGIYVDGGAQIVIRDNVVRRADIGIEVGAENGRGHTDHVRVLDNRVSRSAYTGLALGGYDRHRGEVYAVTVRGNRFRNDNTLADGSPELLLQFHLHHTRILDNLVTATAALVLSRTGLDGLRALNARVRVDHNDYGGPVQAARAQFVWLGHRIIGFKTYQERTGVDGASTWTRR
jgi:hypothetical protein